MIFKDVLGVALFGALGVIFRYLSVMMIAPRSPSFPMGTLSVNLIGSFLIGVIFVLIQERGILPASFLTYGVVGFLGGFTTFSSFSWESLQLIESGRLLTAAFYLIGSPIVGVICAYGGVRLTKLLCGI